MKPLINLQQKKTLFHIRFSVTLKSRYTFPEPQHIFNSLPRTIPDTSNEFRRALAHVHILAKRPLTVQFYRWPTASREMAHLSALSLSLSLTNILSALLQLAFAKIPSFYSRSRLVKIHLSPVKKTFSRARCVQDDDDEEEVDGI